MSEDISLRAKLGALHRVLAWKPALTAGIVGFGIFAALLEGIGLSFILPIIEVGTGAPSDAEGGIMRIFLSVYSLLSLPFSLGFLVLGVALVMTIRYAASFTAGWLRLALRTYYERHLRTKAYDRTLDAEVAYFDREGSDHILNAIITEARYSSRVIRNFMRFLENGLLAAIYLAIAFYLSAPLTSFTLVVLGIVTYVFRGVLEPGFVVGDRVASANERVQAIVQAGTQGIRDVKVFNMRSELFEEFRVAIDRYVGATIHVGRNDLAIDKGFQLSLALMVFALIYFAFVFTALSMAELGLFLFAMFQLAPLVSRLNRFAYRTESYLSHLVRTQRFVDELAEQEEPRSGEIAAPAPVERVRFEDVWFAYDGEGDPVLADVSFTVAKGEFIGFVGQSGAGKSTIAALLARLYTPDRGTISSNGTPIEQFDIESWRERVALVRQDPYIFADTLGYNLTVGNREASQAEIDRVCRIARVDEFIDDLPEGYETMLGDDGVRLSGGQRQRVALARALLQDADILILDEATSDLDSHLEREVQQAIEAMDHEYAIIAIAHRLSTVENADRIYTVEDGRITEVGTHEDLIANDGTYAELYALQH